MIRPAQEINFAPQKLSILVVDDHPQMRKAMARILSAYKFANIFEASSGSEAMKILNEQTIDMVICDLYLYDIGGFDILELVRNRDLNSDIPFLIVTGEGSKDEIVKAADRGANNYLLKPFRAEDLQNKVLNLLNIYHKPSNSVKLLREAERLVINNELDKALAIVEHSLKLDEQSLSAKYLKALILSQTGQTDLALRIHQQNIEFNPSYYRSYAAIAEIYLKNGRINEAIEAMEHELELNPKQPRRQTQLGNLLLDAGRADKAILHFREALKENVKYMHALFGMGKAYAALKNLEKSIYYFKRVRRHYPKSTRSLDAIVSVCLAAGDSRLAEYTLKDEKNTNKSRLDTYVVLSKLYLRIEEKEKAQQVIQELLALKADSIDGLKMKALIHTRYDEIDAAIATYRSIPDITKDPEAVINFADLLIKCGKTPEALNELYKFVIAVKPNHSILSRFITCYTKHGQNTKALFLLTRALQSLRSHLPFTTLRAELLQERKRSIPQRRKDLAS